MELRNCEYCGTAYDARLSQCPLCGRTAGGQKAPAQPAPARPRPAAPEKPAVPQPQSGGRRLRQEPGGREFEIFGYRDTSYFYCTMVTVSGAMARKNTGDVQIGIVVSGEGCIRCGENALPVKQGSEVFFPCQVRDAVFEGDFSIILCNPGVTAEYK